MQLFKFCFFIVFLVSCNKKPTSKTQQVEYYPNKNIKSIKNYLDGKLNGEAIWFYESGVTEQRMMYNKGVANGHAYYFYKSGALSAHRFFRNDIMTGYMADYWDDTASIIKTVLYFGHEGKVIYKKNYDRSGKFINQEGSIP